MQDAARFLGVSRSSLLRLEAEGLIAPYRTAGGHRRYHRGALTALRSELTRRHAPWPAGGAAPLEPEAGPEWQSSVISRIGATLIAERDLGAMLAQAMDAARFLSGATCVGFFHRAGDGKVRPHLPGDPQTEPLWPLLDVLVRQGLESQISRCVVDLGSDARFTGVADAGGELRSLLIVPVCRSGMGQEDLCGLIVAAHNRAEHFGAREEDLLAALAVQVGVALENGRMYDEVSRRNRMLTVLNQVSAMLVVEHDQEAALRRVLDACRSAIGATSAVLLFRPGRGESLNLSLDSAGDMLSDILPLGIVEQTLGGSSFVVADTRREPAGKALPLTAPCSLIAMPLCSETGPFTGGIFLGHRDAGHFDETHREMVRALASQAIVAVEKMLTADQNEEIRQELESIFHSIADPLTVVDPSLTIVECNDGLLRRLGKERKEVVGRHYLRTLVGNIDEGLWNVAPLVFKTGQPQTARVPMVTGDGAALLMDVTAYPVRDARGNVVKVVEYAKEVTAEVRLQLTLLDRNRELDEATKNLERQAAELDGLNRQLREKCEELERIAVTDVMTGLPNHRAFQQNLLEELRRARRLHLDLSLLLLDVDHFKAYNDTFGHPAGDEVLRDVGVLMLGAMRETDGPARYGGEEFAVVLPRTDKQEAARIAEGIRAAIEAHTFPKRDVTVSIGVASFLEDAGDKDALIWYADQALYAAKQAGRNTTRVWPVPTVLARPA